MNIYDQNSINNHILKNSKLFFIIKKQNALKNLKINKNLPIGQYQADNRGRHDYTADRRHGNENYRKNDNPRRFENFKRNENSLRNFQSDARDHRSPSFGSSSSKTDTKSPSKFIPSQT